VRTSRLHAAPRGLTVEANLFSRVVRVIKSYANTLGEETAVRSLAPPLLLPGVKHAPAMRVGAQPSVCALPSPVTAAEDPEKILEQATEDMQGDLIKLRSAAAEVGLLRRASGGFGRSAACHGKPQAALCCAAGQGVADAPGAKVRPCAEDCGEWWPPPGLQWELLGTRGALDRAVSGARAPWRCSTALTPLLSTGRLVSPRRACSDQGRGGPGQGCAVAQEGIPGACSAGPLRPPRPPASPSVGGWPGFEPVGRSGAQEARVRLSWRMRARRTMPIS
jgi:hypothetical protein